MSGTHEDPLIGGPERADPSTFDRTAARGRKLSAQDRSSLLERCTAELRKLALLIDPERLLETCVALIEATTEKDEPGPPETWIERCIELAIQHCLRLDAQRAAGTLEIEDEHYEFLAELFFIPAGREVHSAHAFHRLPLWTRRATFELLLHGKSVKRCLDEKIAEDRDTLVARAREGLLAIMQISEAMLATKQRRPARSKGRSQAEEAARILARHAQAKQFCDPYWHGYLHRSIRVGEALRVANQSKVAEDATRLLGSGRLPSEIRSALEPLVGAGQTALESAQASLRILETDIAWILLTYEYMRLEEWEACRRSIERSLESSTCTLHRSIALEQAGMLMIRRGRITDAVDAYQRSADVEPGRPFPPLFAFLLSTSIGDSDGARRFGRRAEDLVDEDDLSVDASIDAFLELKRRGVLAPNFQPAMRSDLGPATARILNALPP